MRHLGELPLRFIDETASQHFRDRVARRLWPRLLRRQLSSPEKRRNVHLLRRRRTTVHRTRASGAVEDVTLLEDGTFSTAVFLDEPVTLGLRMYNGTNGVVQHNFTVTHDAGDDATGQMGAEPTFNHGQRGCRSPLPRR